MKFKYTGIVILIIFMTFLSAGCGSSGGGGSDGGGSDSGDSTAEENGDTTVVLGKISLATSQVSVRSDNLDIATITATVLDTNNAVVEGVTVSFSANDGEISFASVDTGKKGKAEIEFSSGIDKTNRVATIIAQVTGLSPVQIPIQITGTTILLSTDSSNIAVGESPAILTILVIGVDDVGVPFSLVKLSAEPAGVVTLSKDTDDTNSNGNLEVDITGVAAGSVTVTVQALGVTATQDYTVGTSDEVFCITIPSEDPYSLPTSDNLTITVNAPTQEYVQFATTLGTWDWGDDLVVTKAVSGGSAEAVLSSSKAGTANVQVLDGADPLVTDSLTVIFSVPSDDADQIALQASATVMPPSTEDVTNSVILTATVKNSSDQVVSNAAVAFSIVNPTGGGESIFPVVAYTDAYGVANSTFTSGSLSTDNEGVEVKVTVVSDTSITDTVNIVIGGTAGSVVIGRSTEIESIDNDTAYKLPMSVLVADSNGNPVASATVSLGAWPLQYSTGYWTIDPCVPIITGTYDNEDEEGRNLILDADEDTNEDGQLTPLSSAAGSLPATVTTDKNGVANFDLVYLKQYAVWIEEEIRASTLVLGTETTSILEFTLPYLKGDACNLPHSPYGGGSFTIEANSGWHGTISPSEDVEVNCGDDQAFIITAFSGYVSSVRVDGEIVGEVDYYVFENVTEDHTIDVIFVLE
jgi:Bacterial Ig-like domain (group 1)